LRNRDKISRDLQYKVLAVFGEPRRMAASTALNGILRDAAKTPLLRMTFPLLL
jgi:hypothetical protein